MLTFVTYISTKQNTAEADGNGVTFATMIKTLMSVPNYMAKHPILVETFHSKNHAKVRQSFFFQFLRLFFGAILPLF